MELSLIGDYERTTTMKKRYTLSALLLVLLVCLLSAFASCDEAQPTEGATAFPTEAPTDAPTVAPTDALTDAPTEAPTEAPTVAPTEAPTDAPTEEETENAPLPANYTWTLADLGACVDFHTDLQKGFLLADYKNVADFADGKTELSRPMPITLSWTATKEKENDPAILKYTVEISEDSKFANALSYETAEASLDVCNLYVATLYYWRVTATLEDGQTVTSEVKAFATADSAPRNLYVDGITNVRDLGGWRMANGKRVKQGMIYRSGRLNTSESDELHVEITDEGIATMRDLFGIKTQIDLRRVENNEVGALTASPLGEDVTYISAPMDWDVDNMLKDNIEQVKYVFSLLADERNYPIVYHCNIGTDRTGMFAFLIHALLGVSEENLYRDYLFSNFGVINGTRTWTNLFRTHLRTVKEYEGETLAQQTRNCLIALGVPEAHLDAVVRIMTEN